MRNLNTFQRFLKVAALTDGEIINYNNIAQDCRMRFKVDAVIDNARLAIKIKSVEEVLPRHLKGLKSFSSDYPESRTIMVSLNPLNRKIGTVECTYVLDFFKMLWNGDFSG